MSESKVKVPMKDGLAKTRQKLKEMRIKKTPSLDLVKIINEVTHHSPKEKASQNKTPLMRDEIAANQKTKEEKALWDSLDKIWTKTNSVDSKKIESAVGKTVKEVRRGKATHRS